MDDITLTPFTREQRRHLEDVRDLWEAWAPLSKLRDEVAGAVAWKTVKDRQYLVRYWQDEDTGQKRMNSLGPRSPDTEALKAKFEEDSARAAASLAKLKPRIEALRRVGRALGLGRLESAAADALRQMWRAGLLGTEFVVVGTAAIPLYEAAGGVLLPRGILPDSSLDLAAVARKRTDLDDIERFLRRADRTFRQRAGGSVFANEAGYRIQITPIKEMRSSLLDLRDLSSEQRGVLEEAFELPPSRAVAIARDGMPVPMVGLDPRAFAVMKFAAAEFDPERRPAAAEIDREQAIAVGMLVERHWASGFDPAWLEAFPGLGDRLGAADPEEGGPSFFM